MYMLVTIAQQVLLAIGLGAIVGIEREHDKVQCKIKENVPMFGVRTAILFSLLGFLFAFISLYTNQPLFLLFGGIVGLVIATSVYIMKSFVLKYTGATTYVAMILVLFNGMLVGLGGIDNYILAGAIAIVMTLFLASKKHFVGWAKKMTDEDILSSLKFMIIAFVILPFLPNTYIDPWSIFNPFNFWLIVVIVSTISFLAYLCLKFFSTKGLPVLGFVGGLISGSPTAFALADQVKKDKKVADAALSGVFLACLTGIISDVIVISAIWRNFETLSKILVFQIIAMTTLLVLAVSIYRKSHGKPVKVKKPFMITPALEFAVFYLILTALSAAAEIYLGDIGIIPVVMVGSLVSSSAMIASIASLQLSGTLGLTNAIYMIILAFSISLLVKYFWVRQSGDKKFTRKVLFGTALTTVLVWISLFLLTTVGWI